MIDSSGTLENPRGNAPAHEERKSRLLTELSEMVREQAEYVELLRAIVRRDLRLRYQNAILGFGWAVLVPLLQMAIFSVVFTRVAPLDTGVPYPVYAYVGLVPWHMFASALRFAGSSLTANPNLVTKVYFPREVLPFSSVLVALFDFVVASAMLVVLLWFYRIEVGAALLFLPVVVIVQLTFTAGLALVVAMANLFYADVKYVFELLLTLWMFATSVLYPIERIGGTLGSVLLVNPMTPIIDAYRAVLLRNSLPEPGPFLVVAIISLLTLVVGWVLFHRAEFRFAEEI